MGLKFVVDSLEGLDESIAGLYSKDDNSGKYTLQVSGAVDKSKLDEFRDNNVALMKSAEEAKAALEKFKGLDVKKYRELMKAQEDLEGKKTIKASKVDAIVAERMSSMRAELTAANKALQTDLQATQSKFESMVIDRSITDASLAHKVNSSAVSDVLLRARSVFQVKDGKLVADGLYGTDGVTPITPEQWVKGLQKTAPHLFMQSSGGGASGSNGRSAADISKLTPAQKITLGLSNE